MGNFRFELNRQGVQDLMKSEEMKSVLQGYAAAMSTATGEQWEAKTIRTRAGVFDPGTKKRRGKGGAKKHH